MKNSNWYQIKNATNEVRWVNLDAVISIAVLTMHEPRIELIVAGGRATHLNFKSEAALQEELECIEEMIMPPINTL